MKLKISLQEWFAVNQIITALRVMFDDMLKTELRFMMLKPTNRYKDAFTLREKDNIADITDRVYGYISMIIKDECLGIENTISTKTLIHLTGTLVGIIHNEYDIGFTFCPYSFNIGDFFECDELAVISEIQSDMSNIRTKLKGFPVFDSVSVKFEDAYKAFCKTSGLSYEDSDK